MKKHVVILMGLSLLCAACQTDESSLPVITGNAKAVVSESPPI